MLLPRMFLYTPQTEHELTTDTLQHRFDLFWQGCWDQLLPEPTQDDVTELDWDDTSVTKALADPVHQQASITPADNDAETRQRTLDLVLDLLHLGDRSRAAHLLVSNGMAP